MPDCLFCKIVAGEIPCHKIYEDNSVLAFLDIKPLNPGHTLLVPKEHAENLLDSSTDTATALISTAKKITSAILQSVGASACNITFNNGAAAGQVVLHTHLHIIPRFKGDGFEAWHREGLSSDVLPGVAKRIRDVLSSPSSPSSL
jgi:histidine triad (HIT) family protein